MRAVTLKLLAAAGVAALVSFSAQAADLPEAPPPAPAYVPEYNWTGLYVGAHAGYGWGEAENTIGLDIKGGDKIDLLELDTIDMDGAVAGGQIGYNYQIGSFVIGAEADLSWSGIEGEISAEDGRGNTIASLGHEINWLGTVRGRAGVAVDRFLVYATGGLAFADVDTTVKVPFFNYKETDNNTHLGWTVGAGVEAFITPNLTAKVEYLYVDLGEEENTLVDFGPAAITTDTDLTAHIVRGGLNYKFTW